MIKPYEEADVLQVTHPATLLQKTPSPKAAAAVQAPTMALSSHKVTQSARIRAPLWLRSACQHNDGNGCPFCAAHVAPTFSQTSRKAMEMKRAKASRGTSGRPADRPSSGQDNVSLPVITPPPIPPAALSSLENRVRAQVKASYRTAAEAFKVFDLQKSNHISLIDFERTLKVTLGLDLTRPEILALMSRCDLNGDGVIDMQEFSHFFKKGDPPVNDAIIRQAISTLKAYLEARYHTMRNAFQALDTDRFGYLKHNDFRRMLEACCTTLTPHELDALFDRFDTNQDGRVSHAEFLHIMAS